MPRGGEAGYLGVGDVWECFGGRMPGSGESIWMKHGLETRWYSPETEQRNFRDVLPVFLKPGGISQPGSR